MGACSFSCKASERQGFVLTAAAELDCLGFRARSPQQFQSVPIPAPVTSIRDHPDPSIRSPTPERRQQALFANIVVVFKFSNFLNAASEQKV